MHKELLKLFLPGHTGDTIESAVFIKTAGACDCMNVRVKVQDMTRRVNPGSHPGNKSNSIEGSLEAFFNRLPGTPGKLGIQRVIELEIDAQHLGDGEGAAHHGNSGNNLLHYPFAKIKRTSLCT